MCVREEEYISAVDVVRRKDESERWGWRGEAVEGVR